MWPYGHICLWKFLTVNSIIGHFWNSCQEQCLGRGYLSFCKTLDIWILQIQIPGYLNFVPAFVNSDFWRECFLAFQRDMVISNGHHRFGFQHTATRNNIFLIPFISPTFFFLWCFGGFRHDIIGKGQHVSWWFHIPHPPPYGNWIHKINSWSNERGVMLVALFSYGIREKLCLLL